jgi:transcriptional regulator with XRE-family HTH domain
MDIQKFVRQRKSLGFSQVELSRGICTQSTLSKFENSGKVPSLSILEQLCRRLGLTIDELNQDDASSLRYLRRLMDTAEQHLMLERFPQAIGQLKKVAPENLAAPQDQMQYYYLQGMIGALTSGQLSATLFNFTKILDELDEEHQTIFSQLAYLGSGILYARQGSMDHADFFFAKVITYLQENASDDWSKAERLRYLRTIMMTYYAAEYHALNHRLPISNKVLEQAIGMCAAQHVTYFLPRIKLLQANNAIEAGGSIDSVRRLLTEAMVFARFNHSGVVEVQVATIRKNFENEIVNND